MRLKRRRSGGRWKRERGMWGVDKNRREEGIDGMHLRSSERLANLSGTLNHPNIRLCIASQAKRKVYGVEIVLYILFTFHFTLLLLTLGASFYIPPSRLFREIVFSIYREFRWLTIYISNFNYPLWITCPFGSFRFFPRNTPC